MDTDRVYVTPDVQLVVQSRKMCWDKAITAFVWNTGTGRDGLKKVYPFVDEPDSNQEKAYWTKVRDIKPWAQRGGFGIKRSWEKLADELCISSNNDQSNFVKFCQTFGQTGTKSIQ